MKQQPLKIKLLESFQNGSVVMFGRVASYRFVDSPSDGRYNLALSQSQLDSACLYESRSPTSPTSWNEEESRPISPVSSVQPAPSQKLGGSFLDSTDGSKLQLDQQQITKPPSFEIPNNASQPPTPAMANPGGPPALPPHNIHQTQNLLMTSLDVVDVAATAGGVALNDDAKSQVAGTEFSNDGDVGNIETETKSISSLKSIGSAQDSRSFHQTGHSHFKIAIDRTSTFPKLQPSHAAASISSEPGGQEPILPAVLEFPEQHQESFLQAVISELDVNSPNFKLAPVYTLYLCARYRASTHYRPDLQPTERAHKLTVFLHHVANLIQNVVQEQYTDAKILSFWMANSSEFLHFLKSDRHISAFSVQAQEVLAESVQTAFRNLVSIFHVELSQTLNQFLSENIDHDSAAGLVLSVLGSAMALLRRCRVNAALTIQLFSQLFHYINVVCFNKFVTTSHMCTSAWGRALTERLSLLELWAEKQGLELAADCHLAKINQCAQFLQAPKTSVTEVQQLACSCFRLNSLQMGALLSQETIPRNLIDTAVRMAESVADELSRADGREIRLEESPELPLALLLPDDGFSCDVVRGIPAGLVDFLSPFQMANMCRLASQPTSIGLWTVYMHQFNQGRSPSVMSSKLPQPEIQLIKLHKNANGMGLSIVAAKGAGQERLGIYIKSVVTGGAADLDGRLQAGDQLLEVDGQSLIGITQERAADHLVRTGPVVTLKVAKQGAIYHGLATLLQQPSPVIQRENEFNCNVYDNDGNQRYHFGRSNESLNFHGSSRSMSRRGSLRQPLTPVMTHTTSTPYLSYHDAYRRMSNPDISQGRRFSVSLSNDDILSNDQLQQIHFDPRYRDCRSTVSLNSSFYNRTRSNSLGSIGRGLAAACSTGIPTMPCIPPPITLSKPTRYDTPPSIYVEDYDSRGSSHNSSREMIKIEESVEPEPESPVVAHVPVFEVRIEGPSTESNLSFVADVNLDDIPFIDDDDDEERETRFYTTRSSEEDLRPSAPPPPVPPPYVAAPPPPPAPTPVSNSATLGNIASIMINPGSRRGSNSSCRKTVSFDIITDNGNARSGSQQDINGGTTTYEDDNYSSHYHHHYQDANGGTNDGEADDDEGVLGDEDEDDELSGTASFRSRLARGTKKSPSEPIFKFCKVKPSASSSNSNISFSNKNINNKYSNSSATRGNNNNNDSNNDSEEEEYDDSEEEEEDIDDAVRQSHVEAIREYVCSNFVTSSSPQDWPRTRARRRMSQSNNNYNTNSVANGDDDHCKLLRNIRLLKESSGANHPHSVNSSRSPLKVELETHRQSPVPTTCTLIRKLVEEEFSHTSKPLESDSYSCQVRWSVEKQPAEPVRIGHGKVKALTAFYDSLKDGNNNFDLGKPMDARSQRLSSSTPNLGSCAGVERVVKEKLTTVEEEEILSQLKQWSEFGSMSDDLDKKCNLRKSASCEDSVHKVGTESRDDKLDGRRKPISRSSVNLNHYQVVDYNWNHQQPDGFILKKVKRCSKNCTNIESNRIQLRLTYLTGGSCPNLLPSVRPATQRPLSPCQPPPKQTLRQLKRQQNLIKILKAVNRGRRMSERDMTRVGTSNDPTKPPVPSTSGQQLLNSKSVPALHHVGGGGSVGNIGSSVNKSRSIHNLAGGNVQDQGFYQNLSVYRAQNQSHPNLGERWWTVPMIDSRDWHVLAGPCLQAICSRTSRPSATGPPGHLLLMCPRRRPAIE
ncbi:conserved hypothetical protein [Culex quinquefasciatus]|uniref:Afadin n=1 Tax=Culex quinquefasciatus TaxID=7176 RepID=B0WKJ7_CULQU|nr:conserved hypothetical protein [Culex quinquefasciatus]|eukprot:XP_001849231.1 conserved hypothetical protein [Culex quinquefasciatus]